jgi:perosamine synthetase
MIKPDHQIPIAKPELGEAEISAVTEVIRSGWIMQGERIAQFEQAFAEYVGAPAAIAVSSGTSALHLALYTANIRPGTSVICPSYSFIATANVIRHCGAEPIFIDIDPLTYNLDPTLLAQVCRADTVAILAVHQVGLPAALTEIKDFAVSRNLLVIEDAACAIGSEYHHQIIGRPDSLAACFSFHPRKIMTTGDGGMVTCADTEFAARARLLRQHGISNGEYQEVGFNYRLTDMQAALGIEQLKRLPTLLIHRREQAQRYTAAFQDHQWLSPPFEGEGLRSNFQSYQLRLSSDAPITRDHVLQELRARGITAQPGIVPIHQTKPYRDMVTAPLPETERAAREVIMLPLYHSLTTTEQDYIINSVLDLTQ